MLLVSLRRASKSTLNLIPQTHFKLYKTNLKSMSKITITKRIRIKIIFNYINIISIITLLLSLTYLLCRSKGNRLYQIMQIFIYF